LESEIKKKEDQTYTKNKEIKMDDIRKLTFFQGIKLGFGFTLGMLLAYAIAGLTAWAILITGIIIIVKSLH
jgi:hypothetical protein